MMSLTPAQDEVDARRKKDAIELCGKNRGPHDYIPIEWFSSNGFNRVTRMMCIVCFNNVAMDVLIENYPEIKI